MNDILVVGYGNTLRRDDGIGPCVAASLAELCLSGVRVRAAHQLVPELAEEIATARAVIFVDASARNEPAVRVEPVESAGMSATTHGWGPAALLALSRTLYGTAPRAWLVAVPGEDFDLGEGLSATVRPLVAAARDQVLELVRRLASG